MAEDDGLGDARGPRTSLVVVPRKPRSEKRRIATWTIWWRRSSAHIRPPGCGCAPDDPAAPSAPRPASVCLLISALPLLLRK